LPDSINNDTVYIVFDPGAMFDLLPGDYGGAFSPRVCNGLGAANGNNALFQSLGEVF